MIAQKSSDSSILRSQVIREKRIYCGEEYLEVDIVAVTNMPEAGKGKKGKSSQAQKNLNDKRSKRRFVQIANTNFGTNDFHISATYNNEHLPMSLEEAEKNVHNYLDRMPCIQRLPEVVRMRGTDRREKQPKRKPMQYLSCSQPRTERKYRTI